jgi:hypothetical protein
MKTSKVSITYSIILKDSVTDIETYLTLRFLLLFDRFKNKTKILIKMFF